MYTTTNPELRRIVPDANGRTKIKVVYVVLEAQYQSALTKAVQNINGKRDNVKLSTPFSIFIQGFWCTCLGGFAMAMLEYNNDTLIYLSRCVADAINGLCRSALKLSAICWKS